MSITQIIDVESIRFSATDLDLMRAFLTDFGMIEAEATGDGVLRFRGTGDAPFIHETSLGEPGLVAYTLRAASIADLNALAEADSVPITDAPGPGGGKMVTLTDPDGFTVEVLADKARVAPLSRGQGGRWNFIDDRERHNVTRRVAPGPAHVARLGHVVLGVSDISRTWAWYQSRFGLLLSDDVRAPNGDVAALFIRCDLSLIHI